MARHTEWSDALERELAEPFPKALHMNKGSKGTFVSVHHYVARLNTLVGVHGWAMETPQTYHAGSKMGICVGVTVLGVTKWNVGDEMEDHGEPEEDGKVRDYGSSSTNSWAQAFKRCCAYGFGLGLYLYDKDFTKSYLNGRAPSRVLQEAATPAPRNEPSLRDRVSALTATLVDPAVQLTDKQRKVVTKSLELADKSTTPTEHLMEAVQRLEAVRIDLGLPPVVATQPDLMGV